MTGIDTGYHSPLHISRLNEKSHHLAHETERLEDLRCLDRAAASLDHKAVPTPVAIIVSKHLRDFFERHILQRYHAEKRVHL